MHKSVPIVTVALLCHGLAVSQERIRCATPPRDPNATVPQGPADCSYSNTNPLGSYAPSFIYRVPVVFHVIRSTSGQGNLSAAQVQSQVDILNEDFRALPGTPGSGGFDTGIEFFLATSDPQGNPTTGITYTTNNTWFSDRQTSSYTTALAWDTNRYLNVYTNSGGGALGYVPNLPQAGNLVGQTNDRIVVAWDTVGRNAPGAPYNQGRTLTHEVGHYLGLFHTFDGGCGSASACNSSGDLICDTNPESQPRFGCPGSASSCGSPDPYRNYMDYTNDTCMTGFTSEQARRMRCTLQHWRPGLAASCVVASATTRNAGSNPQSLFTVPPILGNSWTTTVLPNSTGHSLAVLMGYLNPAQIPLPNGSIALVDFNDPFGPALAFDSQAGPFAIFTATVPTNPALCGLQLSIQAAHFGGAAGFALSNASDLVIGQ